MTRFRDTETGEFVTEAYARANPATTEEVLEGDARQARIVVLEGKLSASRGMDGYKDRVAAIEAELERLRD